jgi:hypothetical protein
MSSTEKLRKPERQSVRLELDQESIRPIRLTLLDGLPEQHRIVERVDELMTLCDRLEPQLTSNQTEGRRLLEAILYNALVPTADLRGLPFGLSASAFTRRELWRSYRRS